MFMKGKGQVMPRFWKGFAASALLFAWSSAGGGVLAANAPAAATPALAPYIDEHIHIDERDPEGSVAALLQSMKGLNGSKVFVLTEPYGPDNPARWDVEKIAAA